MFKRVIQRSVNLNRLTTICGEDDVLARMIAVRGLRKIADELEDEVSFDNATSFYGSSNERDCFKVSNRKHVKKNRSYYCQNTSKNHIYGQKYV